jgi:hypothetical protein
MGNTVRTVGMDDICQLFIYWGHRTSLIGKRKVKIEGLIISKEAS